MPYVYFCIYEQLHLEIKCNNCTLHIKVTLNLNAEPTTEQFHKAHASHKKHNRKFRLKQHIFPIEFFLREFLLINFVYSVILRYDDALVSPN